MAATGRRERSSHLTEHPVIIELGSSKHSEGTGGEGVSFSPTEQLGYGSSSSINLLEISDLAQVGSNVDRPEADTICFGNPGRGMYQLQFKDDDSDVSSVCSSKSEKSSGSQGPTSASQVSDFTLESGGNFMSPTQSPPLQMMDRVGGYESYDPFRIPSAVFQRSRSITPLEWSIASNESLFSIHVGNNSFSRDHALMSSELSKSDELTKSGELMKSDDLFVFSPPPAVITSRETEVKSAECEEEPKMADTIEYNIEDKEGLIAEDLSDRNLPPPAVSWNSSSKSRHSDRSQSSSDSFAFPILADKEAQGGTVPVHAKFQGTPVSSKSTAKCWFPCCSCSCFKFSCCSCSCFKWCCCLCSCYKSSICSCSCCKWSCGSCSCSSCCKQNLCSSSSCWTWSCCSSCHFRHCCHFHPHCHIYPCHFCR
ncbi:uncharacterized protein LOC120081528 isoform X2 [Benincasa hispida]|uniref:uncharacterized protein LOC120081528 isoform X2 n=1 Tax=Benincasa hispida TaxID=102211 RepID=UPI0019000BDA|nr:uncharacterized protein LOC120081528 isoform X2 [Benincasa hispida]